jgi:hypothetical protein
MSVYERESRACDLTGMDPVLAGRIKVWADEMGLTPALAKAVAGCETVSGRYGAQGIFGRMSQMPKHVVTGALLTPGWLIWATKADEGEPFVNGVRLADVQIRDYRSTPEYKLMVDEGLQIDGVPGGSPETSSMFLGLDEDPDGRTFKEQVLSAWRTARAA